MKMVTKIKGCVPEGYSLMKNSERLRSAEDPSEEIYFCHENLCNDSFSPPGGSVVSCYFSRVVTF